MTTKKQEAGVYRRSKCMHYPAVSSMLMVSGFLRNQKRGEGEPEKELKSTLRAPCMRQPSPHYITPPITLVTSDNMIVRGRFCLNHGISQHNLMRCAVGCLLREPEKTIVPVSLGELLIGGLLDHKEPSATPSRKSVMISHWGPSVHP